jgi:MFS family permease
MEEVPRQWRVLWGITLAEVMAMSVWFAATVVAPSVASLWRWPGAAAYLASAVQLGFVAGAATVAASGLADHLHPRHLFAAAAVTAAVTNGLFILTGKWIALGLVLRFLTGAALAGVYPVAVQMATDWFPRRRGLALAILIAGVTVGSALPHLMLGLGAVARWQQIMLGSSALALAAAGLVGWGLPDGSDRSRRMAPFRWDSLGKVLRNRPVVLATLGYFGHNWELYGMWSWLPFFLVASWSPHWHGVFLGILAAWAAFAAIGAGGGLGALLGGWAGERWGRTATTIGALTVSGLCAVTIGFTYRAAPVLTILIAAVWGISVVADSAQFSTVVTELSSPEHLGSALNFQMATGFLVTVGSIAAVGSLWPVVGWRWAFWPLAIGPVIGIAAMVALRRRPEAARMARGLK